MKKLLGLLAIFLMFNSCDDGELTVDNVDFGDAAVVSCGTKGLYYKLNGNEVLILEIPVDQNAFSNVEGTRTYPINSANKVLYRIYNGTVGRDNVCATIQPGTPQVTEEWFATSGIISIFTSVKLSNPDPKTGAIKISGYNHEITFENIVYAKSDGSTIVFSENVFGDVTTNATNLPFNFTEEEVYQCSSNKIIYNVSESGLESLVIQNIDPTIINKTLGEKSYPIGTDVNMVIYQYYNGSLPANRADYFCGTSIPLIPVATQKWTAKPGDPIAGTGMINVNTEDNGKDGFKYTITFQKVTFSDAVSGSSFFYGNEIFYGILRPK